jgi:hypothetical protein
MKSFKEFINESSTKEAEVFIFPSEETFDTMKSYAEKFAREEKAEVSDFKYKKVKNGANIVFKIKGTPLAQRAIYKKLEQVSNRLIRMER